MSERDNLSAVIESQTEFSAANIDSLREREIKRMEQRGEQFIRHLYSEASDNQARVNLVIDRFTSYYIEHIKDRVDVVKMNEDLHECVEAQDEDEFVKMAIRAIHPLLEDTVDHPAMARRVFTERHEFTPLNEILSYGLTEDGIVAHIHLAPARDIKNIRALVINGLKELAKQISSDEKFNNLKRVAASSWIIAEHPEIMRKLGFTIDGPVSEESAARARAQGETRTSESAHIDREDFLERYLK